MPAPKQGTWAAAQGIAVTPSDSVSVGGDVVVIGLNSTTAVTYKNVPTGAVLPVQAVRVNATSTTATNIVALY